MLCPFLGIKVIFGVRILGLSSVNSAGDVLNHCLNCLSQGGAVVFICSLCGSLQLFRRVAAALPGMESTQDKSREDSILSVPVPGITLHQENPLQPSLSSWTSQREGEQGQVTCELRKEDWWVGRLRVEREARGGMVIQKDFLLGV